MRNSSTKNITNFIEEWPIIKHPQEFLLLLNDFDHLHLTEVKLNIEEWNRFFTDIQTVRRLKNHDSIATALCNLLKLEDINEGNKIINYFCSKLIQIL